VVEKMGKFNLKKLMLKNTQKEIINGFSKGMGLTFSIIENDEIIYSSTSNDKKFRYCYPLHIGEDLAVSICMDREEDSFVKMIECFIHSEMEKKALAVEILSKYKELNIFYGLSEKLALASSIKEVAKVAFQEAKKDIKASFSTLLLEGDGSEKMEVAFSWNEGKCDERIDAESKFVKDMTAHGRADVIEDIKTSFYEEEWRGLQSLIFAPVIIKEKVCGLLVMGNEEKVNYSSGDLKLLSSIAFLVGVSVERTNLYNTLEETFFQTLKALSETIEKRDTYTGGHVQRVMEYAILTGNEMGFSREELVRLKLAALMHDIGKVGIRDEILGKNKDLSEEEYNVIKLHTLYGAEIIGNIRQLKEVVPSVRAHHERFDGKGYPDGLKGEEIPIDARIIAVVDTFDAMITDRPYRKGLKEEDAIEELIQFSGIQFDEKVVTGFIKGLKKRKDRETKTPRT
jgi:HD-GYP domain-containing protein (c-di-GMP phosphodiesterase class II)